MPPLRVARPAPRSVSPARELPEGNSRRRTPKNKRKFKRTRKWPKIPREANRPRRIMGQQLQSQASPLHRRGKAREMRRRLTLSRIPSKITTKKQQTKRQRPQFTNRQRRQRPEKIPLRPLTSPWARAGPRLRQPTQAQRRNRTISLILILVWFSREATTALASRNSWPRTPWSWLLSAAQWHSFQIA